MNNSTSRVRLSFIYVLFPTRTAARLRRGDLGQTANTNKTFPEFCTVSGKDWRSDATLCTELQCKYKYGFASQILARQAQQHNIAGHLP